MHHAPAATPIEDEDTLESLLRAPPARASSRGAIRTPNGRAIEIVAVGSADRITVLGAAGEAVAYLEVDERGVALLIRADSV
jgi:hypothetical protein